MISILIPWRTDNGPREAAWNRIKKMWYKLPYELCVGMDDDTGPFNFSRLANKAAREATGDVFLIYGADCLPDVQSIEESAEIVRRSGTWLPMFSQTAYYNEAASEKIIAGADPRTLDLDYTLPFCTGSLAIHRDAWLGYDERFSKWGAEDSAQRQALAIIYGNYAAIPYTLRCLWHEGDHRVMNQNNSELMRKYELAQTEDEMRALVGEGLF